MACCPFDVFKQFIIFVIISKRRRAAIKQAKVHTLSRGGPLTPPRCAFLILFYLFWFFWLMSVTATGNKMLVRVCAVASEPRLWYIVRPFASVSWLPRHRPHVYWLGVNKAKGLCLFPLSLPLQKGDASFDVEAILLSGNINAFCCSVSFAPSLLAFFYSLHRVRTIVQRRFLVFTLTLIVIVENKLKV